MFLEKRQLGDLVLFTPGLNQTRAEKQFDRKSIEYYDQSSFEKDFNHEDILDIENDFSTINSELVLKEHDIVISASLQLAAKVRKNNVGKVLPINFIKVDFTSEQLDKDYFIYLFNSNKEIQRLKEREMQGTGLVQRISLKSLEQLVVPVLPIEDQKKIGAIHTSMVSLQSNLVKYGDLLDQFTKSILNEVVKGD